MGSCVFHVATTADEPLHRKSFPPDLQEGGFQKLIKPGTPLQQNLAAQSIPVQAFQNRERERERDLEASTLPSQKIILGLSSPTGWLAIPGNGGAQSQASSRHLLPCQIFVAAKLPLGRFPANSRPNIFCCVSLCLSLSHPIVLV